MSEIRLSKSFSKQFADLQIRAENGEGDANYILKLIEKGISTLVNDRESGNKIQKNIWPNYYSKKFEISNLWRLRLDKSWKMIYTIIGDDVRIVTIVLDVLNHKKHNKMFGYK